MKSCPCLANTLSSHQSIKCPLISAPPRKPLKMVDQGTFTISVRPPSSREAPYGRASPGVTDSPAFSHPEIPSFGRIIPHRHVDHPDTWIRSKREIREAYLNTKQSPYCKTLTVFGSDGDRVRDLPKLSAFCPSHASGAESSESNKIAVLPVGRVRHRTTKEPGAENGFAPS
jgi:hypothetical protein